MFKGLQFQSYNSLQVSVGDEVWYAFSKSFFELPLPDSSRKKTRLEKHIPPLVEHMVLLHGSSKHATSYSDSMTKMKGKVCSSLIGLICYVRSVFFLKFRLN